VTEISPEVQTALGALRTDPARPVKLLVVGGVGTGKSTAMAAIRDALRRGGISVFNRPPRSGDIAGAFVVDDAHLLTDEQLGALADAAADPANTVVVAAQPREHDPALRALMATIEHETPRIVLGRRGRAEVARQLSVSDPSTLDALMGVTGGVPFLVDAAGSARSEESSEQAAHSALLDRLRRLDEPVLAAILIMSLSSALGTADVAAALGITVDAALPVADQAHATGLFVAPSADRFTATVHRAVAQAIGAARHHGLEYALLHSQSQMSTLSVDLAMTLAEHGLRDERLAAALADHASRARPGSDGAPRVLRAALDAGATDPGLPERLADALALAGDCQSAATLGDDLLESGDPARRATAVRVAASVAAHDGNAGRAAELFSWLATCGEPGPDTAAAAAGAIVLIGAGRLDAARATARASPAGPPTLSSETARALAEGLLQTLDEPYRVAAATLGQAVAADAQHSRAMPDSPAALATLAALHAGDPARARSVIARALATDFCPMFRHRHRLLSAWSSMQEGQLLAAASTVSTISALPASGLHRRDALWAAALHAAIARRAGDVGALQRHWFDAMDILAEYSIDLYCLLPLGELWVAAARLGLSEGLAYPLDRAFALLAALGDPPAWSLPLHWAGIHAAILAGSPDSMAPHGQALIAAADASPFAAALAGAGRAWLRVLSGHVGADQVGTAARDLARFGLTWDATRLTGQAALQTADPRVSAAMLQLARDLKLVTGTVERGAAGDAAILRPTTVTTSATTAGQSPLSDREREVAELLLLGLPYRDIGVRLFISPKTVEHHVARMRRRLGAESRPEMLSMLRTVLAPEGRPGQANPPTPIAKLGKTR
jgi:DNA-binding CsgD family transcriptional regulator